MKRINQLARSIFFIIAVLTAPIVFFACGGSDNVSLGTAPDGFLFTDADGNTITEIGDGGTVQLRTADGDIVLAFTPNANIDLSAMVIGRNSSKSWAHFTDATGITGDVTLFVPCEADDDAVRVCPGAMASGAVSTNCSGGLTLTESEPEEDPYTFDNGETRTGAEDCEISADITEFSTGATGFEQTTTQAPPDTSISYSGTEFSENVANDGSVTDTVTATLDEDTFVISTGTMTEDTHYSLSGTAVPTGLTLVVTANSSTEVEISFTGNAASHSMSDDVSGITLTFLDAAFTSGAAPTDDSDSTDLDISFDDNATLAYSGTTFTEVAANDGSISGTVTATVSADTFSQSTGTFTENTHYSLSGSAVPTGLSLVITVNSATEAEISFTGNANDHQDADDVTGVTVTFLDAAFTVLAPVDGTESEDFDIDFDDNASLSYSATAFNEDAVGNDGTVSETVTITLSNDTFSQASGTFTENTHYTLSGTAVPTGLTLVVTVNSTTECEISFTGTATSHAAADSVSGIVVTFENAAFTTAIAPLDGTDSESFDIDFVDPNIMLYTAGAQTDANLGGRSGADATCSTAKPAAANQANVRAFISISGSDEIADLATNYSMATNQEFISSTGTVVANDFADLLDGSIDVTLQSAGVMANVIWYSGSDSAGALHTDNCSGYSSNSGNGEIGLSVVTNTQWIERASFSCANSYDLLCIAFD